MVGFSESLQREFAGAVEAKGWENQAAGAAADVQEQAAALASHMRKHRAVDANRAEEIRLHNLVGLIDGDRFRHTEQGVTGIVYGYVDASRLLYGGAHGLLHGSVIGDVELHDFQRE